MNIEPFDDDIQKVIARRVLERNLALSPEQRLDQGHVKIFRPGIDGGPAIRVFDTMEDYRAYCETLPRWLGM
ncbi:MAG: hypothetical protein ABI579_05500 [Candidatus Sumerlaeota bacterium]